MSIKRFCTVIGLVFFMVACTSQQISQTLGTVLGESLTTEQVAAGLKEALSKGVTTGAQSASKTDGYFKNPRLKIPMPEEMQNVERTLRQVGLGDEVDKFILTLNRGAENAAKEAAPIFLNAIKSMTIQDAWGILKGNENAATQYLERTTTATLKEKFKPVIQEALQKVNATKYYSDIVTNYNRIPGVNKLNPDLNEYATEKAIEGLFILVADEEANIRKNPAARTSELLRKVFAQAD